jgi:hypothetical protein
MNKIILRCLTPQSDAYTASSESVRSEECKEDEFIAPEFMCYK